MKRLLDVMLATAGLLILSPVLAVAALAVLVGSGLPVIYRQIRVGRHFEPFTLYKFRTMTASAEEPGIAAGAEPRVTRVGHALRLTKIDELPQLFNVVRGDMSLVGPRPELPKYVDLFRSEYELILTVRPGITDPASIKYRDEAAIFPAGVDADRFYTDQILPDKIAMARDYVTNRSLSSDVRILAQTLSSIVSR